MKSGVCDKCGSRSLIGAYICVRCPICGERYYGPVSDKRLMWSEHKTGLMYGRGGWLWMHVIEPPSWFIEEVV